MSTAPRRVVIPPSLLVAGMTLILLLIMGLGGLLLLPQRQAQAAPLPAGGNVTITQTLGASPDLALGERVTVTITLVNQGAEAIVTLPLVERLDLTCFRFVGADPPPDRISPFTGQIEWDDLGPLAPGDSRTVALVLEAQNDCGATLLTARVEGATTADGSVLPPSESSQALTLFSGLAVEKRRIAPEGALVVGQVVTFTITVENRSAELFRDVNVYDQFDPALLQFVGGAPPPTVINPGEIGWVGLVGDLSAGEAQTLTVWFRTLAEGPALNEGIAIADDKNGQPLPPVADAEVVVPLLAALTATKNDALLLDADANGVPSPGDTLRYAVELRNSGSAPLTGVRFSDSPDPRTTLVAGSVTTTQGTVTQGNAIGDRTVEVAIGDLLPGEQVQIGFDVTIMTPLPSGVTTLANQGLVTGNEFVSVPTDDPATQPTGDPTTTVVVAAPLLEATKQAFLALDPDGDGVPSPGDTLRYVVEIRNEGNAAATGIRFVDQPDPNSTLVVGSVQVSQGGVVVGNTPGDSTVEAALDTLLPGAAATVSFAVTINIPLPPEVTALVNQGLATSDNAPPALTDDPTTPPDEDPTITPVANAPLVDASKRVLLASDHDGDGVPSAGDELSYVVEIANRGNGIAVALRYTDTPDPHSTLLVGTVQGSQGVVVLGNNSGDTSVEVAIGDLAPGGTARISYAVLINDPLPPEVTEIVNQGLVAGENIPPTLTDDPTTPPGDDPTVVVLPPVTAILLLSFEARGAAGGVQLRWQTQLERDVVAFTFERADSPDPARALPVEGVLVPAEGTSGGARYVSFDGAGHTGHWYWLVEHDWQGHLRRHGPVRAEPMPYRLLLPMAGR